MRRQLEVSNEVAAALSGSNDQILRTLEAHVECELFLRGNVITLDGEAEAVAAAAVVVRELSDLIEQGHEIAEGTIAAVTDALDQHESPAEVLEDVVWRHRSTKVAPKTVNQKRYVDSIRRNTVTSGSARRARARRGWRSPWPPPRSSAARSTASSSPAPPSRPASASASSRAT